MNLLPAVCFTCGSPAHKIIFLPRGCAAMQTEGFVGICPQHEYTINPIEPYDEISVAREPDVFDNPVSVTYGKILSKLLHAHQAKDEIRVNVLFALIEQFRAEFPEESRAWEDAFTIKNEVNKEKQ